MVEFARFMQIEPEPADHHILLLGTLQKVIDGEIPRLMVFMPPGMAKSTYCTILTPAYFLGIFPDKRVICASYDSELSTDFAGKVKKIVSEHDNYRQLFPGRSLAADTRAKGHWNLKGFKGGLYATGVNSAVTGRRAHLAVLDDLVKGRKEADSPRIMQQTWRWFTSDLNSRLLPGNALIYITTRWSMNDPAGRLLPEKWNGESGRFHCNDGRFWDVLSLPAEAVENDPLGRKPGEWLWSEYYSAQFWEETKRLQNLEDSRNWTSLYQQVPKPEKGIDFKREWFQWYDTAPEKLIYYIAADFAVTEHKGDFTEIGVFGIDENDDIYIAPHNGWWTGKVTSYTRVDRLLDFVQEFKPMQFISEKGVIRNAVEPWLNKRMTERSQKDQKSYYVSTEWLPHIGNKTANSRAFHARCSQRKVYLPRNDIGRRILDQLLEFPAGRNDDIVDCCGLIGRYLQQTVKPAKDEGREKLVKDRWDKAFDKHSTDGDNWKIA